MRTGTLLLAALLTSFACSSGPTASTATLVVTNGRVWSGADEQVPARAVAIAGDRIVAVGPESEIDAWIGDDTRVLDARGGLIAPGFIDSHVHFLTGGYRLSSVQLRDARTPEEFVRRIREFARSVSPGTWITGGDWDHENWGGELPRADWIDAVTPNHPVMVHRLDGHMVLANTAAMRAAGVSAVTDDVAGGEIVRDAAGQPAGIFKDNAIDLVAGTVPDASEELDDRALDAAMEYVARQGVTSVHHMGGWREVEVFRRAHRQDRLDTRIMACTPLSRAETLAEAVARDGRGDEWLRLGCLKGFVDGSLGSHTAAFFEPFTDAPEDSGLFVNSADDLRTWTTAADAAGLQVNIHAIGDRAISTLLDIFDQVASDAGPRDRRFRVEHAQHVRPTDFQRFADLGVIASMQPYHAIDDGRWAERVIGRERIQSTYAFRSFLDHGVRLAFGSDWFVAPPTPLEGLYAAVTRRTLDGAHPDGWVPDQRITLDEALRAYTVAGAYASFEEELKGTLEVGRLADVVVVDQDLFQIAPEAIRDARIAATVVGGRIVFETDFADVVLHNTTVVTMDDARSQATAIAIGGERILAVGSYEDVGALIGPDTDVRDLAGRTVIPGLSETHIHVRDLGFQQTTAVNLEPARDVADVQRLLGERLARLRAEDRLDGWTYPTTAENGPWLFGLGWTQDRLAEKRFPDRHELDAVARDVPISAERIYNGIAINTRVFELLGIDFDDVSTWPDWFTEDPADFVAGDVIFRDENGVPNGVFVGSKAPLLVEAAIPEKSFEQRVESLVDGLGVLARYGITAVVEAGSSIGSVTEVYRAAHQQGRLPLRANVYDGWYRGRDPSGLGDPDAIAARLDSLGFSRQGDDWFRVRGAKSSADGGVGSRSAAVSVPFLPIPEDPRGEENYGAFRDSDDVRMRQFEQLASRGWEIHTHATGDAAIRQTVDVYKTLMDGIRADDPEADLRWSVIHCYLPDEPATTVIAEMAEYGIIAAINPANLYFEGASFLRNIGPERMARHTPYRTFLEAGVRMASGSDYPNNSPDPWVGIYQMISRREQLTGQVYGPEQAIPLLDALETFTVNGAYLTYDDDVRGSLTEGRYADLVVLDADLLSAGEDEVLGMASKVMLTMVGGRIAYASAAWTR